MKKNYQKKFNHKCEKKRKRKPKSFMLFIILMDMFIHKCFKLSLQNVNIPKLEQNEKQQKHKPLNSYTFKMFDLICI